MAEGLVGSKPNKDALVIGCQEMDPLIVIVIVVVVIISVIIVPLSDFIEIQQIQPNKDGHAVCKWISSFSRSSACFSFILISHFKGVGLTSLRLESHFVCSASHISRAASHSSRIASHITRVASHISRVASKAVFPL